MSPNRALELKSGLDVGIGDCVSRRRNATENARWGRSDMRPPQRPWRSIGVSRFWAQSNLYLALVGHAGVLRSCKDSGRPLGLFKELHSGLIPRLFPRREDRPSGAGKAVAFVAAVLTGAAPMAATRAGVCARTAISASVRRIWGHMRPPGVARISSRASAQWPRRFRKNRVSLPSQAVSENSITRRRR
jgi:hypothetical protein